MPAVFPNRPCGPSWDIPIGIGVHRLLKCHKAVRMRAGFPNRLYGEIWGIPIGIGVQRLLKRHKAVRIRAGSPNRPCGVGWDIRTVPARTKCLISQSRPTPVPIGVVRAESENPDRERSGIAGWAYDYLRHFLVDRGPAAGSC